MVTSGGAVAIDLMIGCHIYTLPMAPIDMIWEPFSMNSQGDTFMYPVTAPIDH